MPNSDEDERPLCKYGTNCYQKNLEHHRRFKHPKRKAEDDSMKVNKKAKSDIESMDSIEEESEVAHNSPTQDLECVEKIKHNSNDIRNGFTTDEDSNKLNQNESSNIIDMCMLGDDIKQKIETVFLVKMPEDFFSFFDFCESLDKNNPLNALAEINLNLVGPYDLFTRDYVKIDQTAALRHQRYYYDPPEFQTVLISNDKNLLHYGYFRDNPKEDPVFVASNEADVDCVLNIVSENLFSAVNIHIEKIKKVSDPFKKMKIQKIQNSLIEWSKKNGFNLDSVTKNMRHRKSKVVAKTFHGAGIVVPFDKKTELGYRKLKEDDKTLKKMLKNLTDAKTDEERKQEWGRLQPVITYASIANDECDFGTGLELGLDLFCFGHEILHKAVLQVLSTSYNLLGRGEFSTILQAHLKDRKRNGKVSTIC